MRKLFSSVICSFLITVSAFAASCTTYGPTTADDNLWRIASELRPNSEVSVQQVMLAIFCCNEDAFYSDNVNALESGKIIKLPDIDRISRISKEHAYLEVEKQNKQWKKANQKRFKRHVKQKKSHKVFLEQAKKPLIATTSSEQSQSAPTTPAPAPVSTPAPQTIAPSAQEIAFIADTNDRLTAIEAKNNNIQNQIIQLSEKTNSIEQNMEQLKKSMLEKNPIQKYVDKLAAQLGHPLFTILFVGVFVFLLLVLFYLLPRRCKSSGVTNLPHRDVMLTKEEYNLMESKEGIIAKLNLARAYIDMGKEAEAQTMLSEVLVNGSPSEQTEANMLLAKIKK